MHRWRIVGAPRAGLLLLLAGLLLSLALGGCGGYGFGHYEPPAVDPNAFPTGYRLELVQYLTTELTDPQEYHGASVTEPTLKPIGADSRYVVCLRIAGRDAREKLVIFFGGRINQYIDPTHDQCAGAVYQPFSELALARPAPGVGASH